MLSRSTYRRQPSCLLSQPSSLARTSASSTSGGPSAISSAFVPGRILLDAPVSIALLGNLAWSSNNDTPGEVGPIWSSAIGGGEGNRGDEEGETAAILDKRDMEMCQTSGVSSVYE